LQNYLF